MQRTVVYEILEESKFPLLPFNNYNKPLDHMQSQQTCSSLASFPNSNVVCEQERQHWRQDTLDYTEHKKYICKLNNADSFKKLVN